MSFEMVGSRIVAPTFGTSIYVWGAIISVVMAAMTLGYALGGKLADQRPTLKLMGLILAGAGIFIGSLPFWAGMANSFFIRMGLQAGSLTASTAFFFIPSVLLAMISPYGVRLAARNISTLGNTAGRISALSSAGSIIGTIATSFFLIPLIGVRSIVLGLGIILLALAGLTLWLGIQQDKRAPGDLFSFITIATLFVGLIMVSFLYPQDAKACQYGGRVLMAKDSLYHRIIVDEINGERHLHFDRSYQSAVDLNDPLKMIFEYTSYLHLAAVAQPKPERALFIGLGGGLAPYKFLNDYPSLEQIDAVEIDPAVIEAARIYFTLPDDPKFQAFAQDGRLFIEEKAQSIAKGLSQPYDLIVIDAFSADAIPYHLTTEEFMKAVHSILTSDGVVAMNIISALDGQKARLIAAMTRTVESVFPQVYLFPVGNRQASLDIFERNILLIAASHPQRWSKQEWQRRATLLMTHGSIQENVEKYAQSLLDEPIVVKNVPLLTDDFAPTDTLQHPL